MDEKDKKWRITVQLESPKYFMDSIFHLDVEGDEREVHVLFDCLKMGCRVNGVRMKGGISPCK